MAKCVCRGLLAKRAGRKLMDYKSTCQWDNALINLRDWQSEISDGHNHASGSLSGACKYQ